MVLDQSLVASDTALLASNVVNEARVQWARRTFDFTPVIKEPDLEVSNLIITGKTTSDMDFYRESRLQLSDNLSVVSGGHALKFGADFNNIRNTSRLDLFFPARVIFANLSTMLTAAVDDRLIAENPCRSSSVRAPPGGIVHMTRRIH